MSNLSPGARAPQLNLLEKLSEVLLTTLGPGPGTRLVVQSRSHHVIGMLDANFLTLEAVIVWNVKPASEKNCFIKDVTGSSLRKPQTQTFS